MISAQEHKNIIIEIHIKTGYYPYGYRPGLPINDIPEILYNFSKNVYLKIGNWNDYSDTTGIRDYTGMVFAIMVNYRHFRTYTSLGQFLADSENISLWEKEAAQAKSLAEIKKDFM